MPRYNEESMPSWVIPIDSALFICIMAGASISIIPTGEVGVLTTFGKAEGVFSPGLNFKIPLIQGVDMLPTTVQKYETNASAASKDLQDVHTVVAVNYQLPQDNGEILSLYTHLRTDYEMRIIQPFVQESVKANTAKYTADELITKRADVKHAIQTSLTEKLKAHGIQVVEVSITNFDFSPEFDKAIEQKVVAEQNKLQMQFELEKRQIEVQKQIAEANASATAQVLQANGEAQARLIRADAEATAIRKITETLSEQYISYNFVQRWDGELPKVYGTSTPLVDVSDFVMPPPEMIYPVTVDVVSVGNQSG